MSGGHYNVEIYSANDLLPAHLVKAATVRSSQFTYASDPNVAAEANLDPATPRYLRVQAVNASGQGSVWTALVAALGTAVNTTDISAGAVHTDPVVLVDEETTVNQGLLAQSVGNATVTIPASGAQSVEIAVDLVVRFGGGTSAAPANGWGEGGDITGNLSIQLIHGGTLGVGVAARRIIFANRTQAALGSPYPPQQQQSYHAKWIDTAPVIGVGTYVLQVLYTASGVTRPLSVTPTFNIQVKQR